MAAELGRCPSLVALWLNSHVPPYLHSPRVAQFQHPSGFLGLELRHRLLALPFPLPLPLPLPFPLPEPWLWDRLPPGERGVAPPLREPPGVRGVLPDLGVPLGPEYWLAAALRGVEGRTWALAFGVATTVLPGRLS